MNTDDMKQLSLDFTHARDALSMLMFDLGLAAEHKSTTDSEIRVLEECANEVSQTRWDMLKMECRVLGGFQDDATAIFMEMEEKMIL